MNKLPTLVIKDNNIWKGAILRFDDHQDPSWSRRDGVPLRSDPLWLALKTARARQRWDDHLPETIVEQEGVELPSIDEWNDAIPKSAWPIGMDGEPEPPWKRLYILYLLDIATAEIFTFANSTKGARVAVTTLEDRWEWIPALFGNAEIYPLVRPRDAPWRTKWGMRRRPDFEIVGYRKFADGVLRRLDPGATALIEPKRISVGAAIDDDVPF